jgi:lipopolysaccharide/colanic/teichoic acid biosynthesis glycosyltransferase
MGTGTGVGRCGNGAWRGRWSIRSALVWAAARACTLVGTVTLTHRRIGLRRWSPAAKRALDISVSAVLLVLALPVCAAIAIAVKTESPGPVFYRAWRVGYRSAPVGVLKFRKMNRDAAGSALTDRHDQRLTRVGAFLAHTHLDELPQFWNVLIGEMSVVGPRPEDPRFTALHAVSYEDILSVRPGITGCTQLAWVDECELLSAARDRVQFYVDEVLPRKVALDRAYATNPRFTTDAKVLLWTPLVLLLGWAVVVDEETPQLRLARRARAAPPARATVLSPGQGEVAG